MNSQIHLSKTEADDRDAFAERLLGDALGAFAIFSVHIGDQLGFYRELAKGEALSAVELARRTDTHERYTREWLEHQAAACILEAQEDGQAGHLFYLPPGRAEVLADRDSTNYMTPLAQLIVGAVNPLETLIEAYRNGSGIPFSDYGVHVREGQANMNRPMFLKQLGTEWLPAAKDVHARLQADPPARIADIGCGAGWSCIGFAMSYPKVRVDGFDLDAASVDLANSNIRAAGLGDRVKVTLQDAGDPALQGKYDLVTAFECLHDMSNPVGVLRTMRNLAGEKGAVIIMDERSKEAFQPCADALEQYLYGFSILHCLPASMAEQPSAATGTVLRQSDLEQFAHEAGFRRVEVLPVDNFFFRFYRLFND